MYVNEFVEFFNVFCHNIIPFFLHAGFNVSVNYNVNVNDDVICDCKTCRKQ